jgi:hypothetical protein
MSFDQELLPFFDEQSKAENKLSLELLERAIKHIEPTVAQLLSKEMPTLLNLLYAYDIPEDKVQVALFGHYDLTPSYMISELFVRRSLLRQYYRKKYSSK